MIEVVVRLSEDDYKYLKEFEWVIRDIEKGQGTHKIFGAILDGTILPKGHGRLFILDEELANKFFASFSFSCQKWISEVGISNATLKVIEADKKESEKIRDEILKRMKEEQDEAEDKEWGTMEERMEVLNEQAE